MDDILNEHEVIKFLTNRGGRCTNFELVSNFKSVLNDPRYQAAARLKFKDIINTVATVGEYQNIKYIEIKKEYMVNNDVFHADISNKSEPSSLSSESSRGSYSSPFSNDFQPYWRYRLATTTKVPSLPPRNPELEAFLKPPGNDVTRHIPINRSVSETTLSQNADLRPVHQIPNYVAAQNRRSSTDNTRYQQSVGNRSDENQSYGNQYASSNVRRLSGNFSPDRMLNTPDAYRISQSLPYNNHGLNRSVSEYSSNVDRRVSANGYPGENTQRFSYHAPSDLQRTSSGYDAGYNRSNYERNSDMYREGYHSDTTKGSTETSRAYNESPPSRKFEAMHGIHRRASNDSGYLTTPFDSPNENRSLKNSPSRRIEVDFEEDESDIHTSANLRNVSRALFRDSNAPTKTIRQSSNNIESEFTGDTRKQIGTRPQVHSDPRIQEIIPSNPNRRIVPNAHSSPSRAMSRDDTNKHSISEQNVIPKRNSTSDLPGKALSARNSEASSDGSMVSLNSEQDFDSSKLKDQKSHSKLSTNPDEIESSIATKEDSPPPLPPARRRKHPDKGPSEEDTKENTEQPNRDWSMASGKVRDRVQHFDDMEKKRNTKRSHSPLTPDKENRIHSKGIGTDDDVSISVLDTKLKKEWFVKAAQCDYHALVALLKKEPKLAAIKTALHWAAKHGDANVIKLIAGAYKVNPNIRSNVSINSFLS
ncbi:uncharacterized protein LOC129957359 isoform X2 [Argiope bruennichi]|uniref:uncharacterized protein LOC129957359 isoform X2 n=1 Tax=Argiope bruennichi TaxID=94029 RepID=UPI002494D37D|nr:uncharacterized protein LOC129957359 isoform X2 [Argiope bruennichi]